MSFTFWAFKREFKISENAKIVVINGEKNENFEK